MDTHSLEKLEFGRVREMVSGFCRCSLGRQLAMAIIPARKQNMIHRWLRQTREMGQVVAGVGGPPLAGVKDIRELVRQAVPPTRLTPEDFATIGETLAATHEIRRWIDSFPADTGTLTSVTERVMDFKAIADLISRSVDSQGQVRDDATERLARIRGTIQEATHQIGVVIGRLLRSSHVTEMLQFPNAMFHGDRMVLPLKSEHRGRLAGIIHRSSDSGATLFVEPAEAVELNNSITRLRRDEHEEIGRILFKLTQAVHANATQILKALDAIGTLDLIVAKVQMARAYDMVVPAISDEGVLRLRSARHPILLMLSKEDTEGTAVPKQVVPIDVRLGEDFDILMITGPNTGGKTVALKTVGLLVLMVHAGLPIPAAEGSCLPVFDDILIDVGDEQSIQQSLSTFSAHMSRILDVLHRANRNTLVLLDELGAGTDPDEGAAIGMAVIERLLALGCPGMITTHLGVLKSAGFTHARVDNAAVEFDAVSLRPTYRLLIGQPGQSNAIAVARHLGMPSDMVAAAESHLSERHKTMTKMLAGTIEARKRAEEARSDAEEARVAAADAEAAARLLADELTRKQQEFEAWAQRVAHLKPGDAVKVLSFDRPGRVARINLGQQRAHIDLGGKTVDVPLSDVHPEDTPPPPPKPARPTKAPTDEERPAQSGRALHAERPRASETVHQTKVTDAPPANWIDAPALSAEQLAALTSGQEVFVRRFQKVGAVIRLKPEKRHIVVDLGTMDVEVGYDEVCSCPPKGSARRGASREVRSASATGGKSRASGNGAKAKGAANSEQSPTSPKPDPIHSAS